MATPSEKHEIHCAKRYLEYTETPFYRAFRDRENPESFDSNYAVLKRMEEAEQSLAAVESYYEGLDVTPKFYSKPDSVTLEESRAFFEAHGYAVHTFECQRMMLLTHTSPELLVHKCPVQIFAGAPLTGAAAQLVRELRRKDFGLRLIDKQLARARAFRLHTTALRSPSASAWARGTAARFICRTYIRPKISAPGLRGRGGAGDAGLCTQPGYGVYRRVPHADDPAAIRLYEKLGFRGTPVREYRAFKGGLPDLYTEAKE
ncbi:MAG: hypothetical protein ACLRZH_16235 [Ruthenibacterium lactatiformans]